MRVWKTTPLLLLLLAVVACSPKPADEPAAPVTPPSETASIEPAPAPAPAPAVTPAPSPAPRPAAPKPASPRLDPAPAPAPSSSAAVRDNTPTPAPSPAPTPAAPPAPKPVVIQSGTELNVILADPLNSGKNKVGDTFTANLAAPVYVGGTTVLDRGSKLQGKVVAVDGAGRVSGKATMALALTSVTHNGKAVPIVTKDLAAEAESSTGRDAKVIGGGAGVGAIIGAIAGGKKGAAIGAAVGGASGTGAVLATKGKEVDFPAEFKLTFTLDKDVSVIP